MKKRVAIIGAGPAGMTAGYEISKNENFECIIYESTSGVGGMARSFELFDRKVDLGPHRFFSNDTRVNKLWLEVIGNNYKMVNRITRIFYKAFSQICLIPKIQNCQYFFWGIKMN